ncbi:MAG: hypothetical protein MZW92_41440 [Comamonadaceae bacterium]|nr:hypothetical protein [Comamonadaceae bacterium]
MRGGGIIKEQRRQAPETNHPKRGHHEIIPDHPHRLLRGPRLSRHRDGAGPGRRLHEEQDPHRRLHGSWASLSRPRTRSWSSGWATTRPARTRKGANTTMIFQADKKMLYMIDRNKKQYSEMPLDFGKMFDAAADEAGGDEEDKAQAKAMAGMMKGIMGGMSAKVTDTGETKKVGELERPPLHPRDRHGRYGQDDRRRLGHRGPQGRLRHGLHHGQRHDGLDARLRQDPGRDEEDQGRRRSTRRPWPRSWARR